MTTLLLSQRHTEDDQALWRAAIQRGWQVERARGIRVPAIDDSDIAIYVEALFAPQIARALGRTLLDPPEDWLVQLPAEFRQRDVRLMPLGEARLLRQPSFIKPPNDKSFAAQVYDSGAELPVEFTDEMSVLVAEPIRWEREYRCFVLAGEVRAFSPYLRDNQLARLDNYAFTDEERVEVIAFAQQVAADDLANLPRAIALDVGVVAGRGWAVVEPNGAWGAGIYGCDPGPVLDVIHAATLPAK